MRGFLCFSTATAATLAFSATPNDAFVASTAHLRPLSPTAALRPGSSGGLPTTATAFAFSSITVGTATVVSMSANKSRDSKRRSVRQRSFGEWARPGAAGRAGKAGLQRGFAFLRRGTQMDQDDGEMEDEDGDYEYDDQMEEYDDALDRNVAKRLKQNARLFRQISWLSWWAQTILSTVAFIILLFSNAVTNRSARGNILGNGVALALGSLVASGASICWTWGYTLKARGWSKLSTLPEVDDAQLRMRNSLRMGLYINVAGMLLALVGAEQIVGTLVAKVLYSQGFQPSVMVGTAGAAEVAQAQFRALDVFIVQANTNTLLSHFCSLAASLWLLARTPKLAKLAKGVY